MYYRCYCFRICCFTLYCNIKWNVMLVRNVCQLRSISCFCFNDLHFFLFTFLFQEENYAMGDQLVSEEKIEQCSTISFEFWIRSHTVLSEKYKAVSTTETNIVWKWFFFFNILIENFWYHSVISDKRTHCICTKVAVVS